MWHARQLRLASEKEWRLWCRSDARQANAPACPKKTYVHDEWMGWQHWLCHAHLDAPTAVAAAHPMPSRKRAAPDRAGPAASKTACKPRPR